MYEGYTMGYDYSVRYMDMSSQENATEVTTILDWAQDKGEMICYQYHQYHSCCGKV